MRKPEEEKISAQTVVVGAKVTPPMKKAIAKFLHHDMHVSISDFIRDAIREKIKRDAPELYAQLFQEAVNSA